MNTDAPADLFGRPIFDPFRGKQMTLFAPPEIVVPNEIKFPEPEKLGSKNSRDPKHTPMMFR